MALAALWTAWAVTAPPATAEDGGPRSLMSLAQTQQTPTQRQRPLETLPNRPGSGSTFKFEELDPVEDPLDRMRERRRAMLQNRAEAYAALRAAGFGDNGWNGTSEAVARRLVELLPVGAPSPVMATLIHALLATPGPDAPRGDDAEGWNNEPAQPISGMMAVRRFNRQVPTNFQNETPQFQRLRTGRLLEAGLILKVEDMVERALFDQADIAGDAARLRADAALLKGETAEACEAAVKMRERSMAAYWIRLRAFCYVLENAKPAARLTVDLLRDSESIGQDDDDKLYFVLMRHLLDGEKIDGGDWKKGTVTPLTYALARHAGLALPEKAISPASPAIWRAYSMQTPGIVDEERELHSIEAAERAAVTGAISPDDLRAVYARVAFPDKPDRKVYDYARKLPASRANAFFYQRVVQAEVPVVKIEILREALLHADASGTYMPAVIAHADLISRIRPAGNVNWAADQLGLAAMASGRLELALRWYEILRDDAVKSADPETMRALRRLTMALMLVHRRTRHEPGFEVPIEAWMASADEGKIPAQDLARNLEILNAAGVRLPESAELWLLDQPMPGSVTPPPVTLPARLTQAVKRKRVAEAVALALILAGPDGPRAESPYFLAQSIRALHMLGLRGEAKRLAFEGLLASPM